MKTLVFAVLLLGLLTVGLLSSRLIKKIPNNTDRIKTELYKKNNISVGDKPLISFILPANYVMHVFASGLGNPRDLQLSPRGTLLVSNPVENTVTALPDNNQDGVADENKVVVSHGNKVHGLAFFKDKLYVAEVNRVAIYNWDENKMEATFEKQFFNLPNNSDHNNRSLVITHNGEMFISLGSTCNVCNEPVERGGSVLLSNYQGNEPLVFAKGLRNAAFLALNPKTGEIWGTEMGRDNLGDNTPPDEINILKADNNYGWPNCYGNQLPDLSFNKKADCKRTTAPIYEIPAHSAPLGLTFITSPQFPNDWQGDLLVAYHGSWNRSKAVGYKVVHLVVRENKITSSEDFLTGFNPGTQKDDSLGRPVDLIFDKNGNLYVSDDKAGVVYIIQKRD